MAQTFQGDVTFTINDKPTPYRYEVSVTDEHTIRLWIEERKSKKQWTTNALETKDFVTNENVIPGATSQLYAEKFAACLRSTEEGTTDTYALTQKGSERVLKISLLLQWGSTAFSVEYQFVMHAVPLTPIDILSARLRDVEETVAAAADVERVRLLETENAALKDEVQRLTQRVIENATLKDEVQRLTQRVTENATLKEEVQRLTQRVTKLSCQTKPTRALAQAKTVTDHSNPQTLVWKAADGTMANDSIAFLPTGHIQFRTAGLLSIDFVIKCGDLRGDLELFDVMKSDRVVASCRTTAAHHSGAVPFHRAMHRSGEMPFHCALQVEANDQIYVVVKARGGVLAGSSIMIVKL